jgi:CubicO group peptidase (beta-lactamase class C family)
MTGLAHLALDRGIARLLDGFHGGPGCAIGVVQAGELTIHRCAGLASLELGVPVGHETTFRVASVTKQFTCAAILMLAAEGRLRLDDEAREHLPELAAPEGAAPELAAPEGAAPVTVAHLIHNTSGIRDMLGIMRQGGADLGQPVRPDELMAGILRQRSLNFAPGSRFLYSNSNFLLLGRIAERVSGEPLGAFLERRVFIPAGMTRTRLVEEVGKVVPGLATGYVSRDGAWTRAPHAFPLHGEGGLVSCVEDLALWSRWLDANPDLASVLATQAPFGNGVTNLYARGQVVREYRGVRTVGHGGLWPGYRTEFLRAPAEEVAVIVITNRADADPSLLTHQALDLLLDGRPGVAAAPVRPDPGIAQAIAGRWLDPVAPMTLDIAVAADGRVSFTTYGLSFEPSALPDGRLGTVRGMGVFALRRLDDGDLEVELDAGYVAAFHPAPPGTALPDGLAGVYRSDEMDATWTITTGADGTQVTAHGPVVRGGAWQIEPIMGDFVRVHAPDLLFPTWLDVRALRNEAGQVTELEVSGGRVKRVLYQRVPE